MEKPMLVVATDGSPAARQALRTGVWLAERLAAELRVVTVRPFASRQSGPRALEVGPEHRTDHDSAGPAPVVLAGLPGIEIVRYAESVAADLIIFGRSLRSAASRWLIGDTGDAVARRSGVPCLSVPAGHRGLSHGLVAVDGTERGFIVLQRAARLAADLGIPLSAVTVESDCGLGPDRELPLPSPTRVRRIGGILEQVDARRGRSTCTLTAPVVITRHGEVVAEVLAELESQGADLLAVGYHRGGPSGILESHSIGRRLAHWAPTAVLTVPL